MSNPTRTAVMGTCVVQGVLVGLAAQLVFAFVYGGVMLHSNLWPFGIVLPFPVGAVLGAVAGVVVARRRLRARPTDEANGPPRE